MTYTQLVQQIRAKGSFLCVGLDSDMEQLPTSLRHSATPLFDFNKAIIDATAPYTVAYKPNLAFYEALGSSGWAQLAQTLQYIRTQYPEMFIIADAKRGDIGNTAQRYAQAFFENMDADAVTLAPYMGMDAIDPFLAYPNKWAIVLALTSNPSAEEFEIQALSDGELLYERVIRQACARAGKEQLMFVAGATRPQMLGRIRELAPEHFLLVPGVGAQGGSLAEVAKYGLNANVGLLVNVSRGIIYADKSAAFAEVAAKKAEEYALEMKSLLL
jgi:orotidine 5''-phosphate decarboxylase, subfamily 2